jgi:hypothetical protein
VGRVPRSMKCISQMKVSLRQVIVGPEKGSSFVAAIVRVRGILIAECSGRRVCVEGRWRRRKVGGDDGETASVRKRGCDCQRGSGLLSSVN